MPDATLSNVYEALTELQRATRKNDKIRILSRICEDELVRETLKFALDPQIITGLSTAKMSKTYISAGEPCSVVSIHEAMDYLKKNNTGKDADLYALWNYIRQQPNECEDFLIQLFTKSLKLGVEAKSVNKALGYDLIPTWEVQQAYPIDKYPIPEGSWFCLTQKMNGIHATFIDGKLITRQGKEVFGMEHVIKDIRSIYPEGSPVVLGGELIRKNEDHSMNDSDNFTYGTGIINAKGNVDKSCIEYSVYEILTKAEFLAGSTKDTFKQRRAILENTVAPMIKELNLHNISVTPSYYKGTDQNQLKVWLDYADSHDMEGMFANLDAPYQNKRNRNCLKVKSFSSMDLSITAVEEGTGKLTGTMGALVVDFKGNEVRVGSGFDDGTRAEIWSNKDKYIGRVAEVKYKGVSKDKKTGKESLQFPTFLRIREDGKEASEY